MIVQFLIDILVSYRFFSIPFIANIITNILALTAIIMFHDVLGVIGISIAILVSYVLQIMIMSYIMIRTLSWKFTFSRVHLSSDVVNNIGFAQAGNVFSILGGFAPFYFLSGVGTGVLTALNYGQRIFDIPGTVFTNQFSYITGIKLNELYAKQDFNRINEIFIATTKLLTYILMPIATIFFLKADDIIILIFRRGAFSYESTLLAANFLRYLSLNLPFMGIFTIGARLFMAGQIQKKIFWVQASTNSILIILISLCIRLGGPEKYPLALFIVSILNVIATGWLIRRYFNYIKFFDVIIYGGEILAINIALALILNWIITYLRFSAIIDLSVFVIVFSSFSIAINIRGAINHDVAEIIKNLFIQTKRFISLRRHF